MRLRATRPRDVVADVLARLASGRSWAGSVAELLAALDRAATGAERADRA